MQPFLSKLNTRSTLLLSPKQIISIFFIFSDHTHSFINFIGGEKNRHHCGCWSESNHFISAKSPQSCLFDPSEDTAALIWRMILNSDAQRSGQMSPTSNDAGLFAAKKVTFLRKNKVM